MFSVAFERPVIIDAHGLKFLCVAQTFAKPPGSLCFLDNISRGKTILGVIEFLSTSCFKNLPRGPLPYPKISSVTRILKF